MFFLFFSQWSSTVAEFENWNIFAKYTDTSYKFMALFLRQKKKKKWKQLGYKIFYEKYRKNDRERLCLEAKRVQYRQFFYKKTHEAVYLRDFHKRSWKTDASHTNSSFYSFGDFWNLWQAGIQEVTLCIYSSLSNGVNSNAILRLSNQIEISLFVF